ncbi:class I SAM-dependent methyltransferase [Agrobacterium sp. V1]|uniref:class I SAM-dependent methyltransferase n=1 Tax=Agrobacterium sp. V1 TaxID=3061957 RepID=UPI00267153A6|nr:methyltransferase domain-containing protein [Agrobacterium sp. V1]MDO3445487.1 methyltransferase domain-containing protein [Agrobacterium sp. V1]
MREHIAGKSHHFIFSLCSCHEEAKQLSSSKPAIPIESSRSDIRGDKLRFFNAWRAKPLQIAALAPSGSALAQLMTKELSPKTGKVLELGPGTGVFTRAILRRGVPETDLTLVEFEEAFAELLTNRFPDATVLQIDASSLPADTRLEQSSFGAVVSGLPLLSMRPRTVMRILEGAFAALGQGGSFFQFTYGPTCPVDRKLLDRLGLKATRIGGTIANFPPASVYRISRRAVRTSARLVESI